jgi:hypothetical protein
MDDQNIGVKTETKARRAVNELTRSLACQRLTLNAGKTKFLSPEDVVVHFQLDANATISVWDKEFNTITEANFVEARKKFEEIWVKISAGDHVEQGHWDKILKRIYGLAVRVDSDALEAQALHDLIQYPELDERIFAYFAKRNRAEELLGLFESYCLRGENLYEATEAAFFEAALLLAPTQSILKKFKKTAYRFASGVGSGQSGRPLGRASAIIMLYWFAEPGVVLKALYAKDRARELPKEVARAWMACVAALRPQALREVQTLLLGHGADDVARLSRFLTELMAGTVESLGNYKSQKSRWPLPGKYYDTRSWLILDVASRSPNLTLRKQLIADFQAFRLLARTWPEKRVAERIAKRLF